MAHLSSGISVVDWRQRDPDLNEVTLKNKHGSDHTLNLPFPRASALCLNQSHIAYKRALSLRQKLLDTPPLNGTALTALAYDYLEQLMVSALFASTSIEAFSNTAIPDSYQHCTKNKKPDGKEYIQRRYSLDRKLSSVLPTALVKPDPSKTDSIWDPYLKLKDFRDEKVVHSKSNPRQSGKMWRELLTEIPLDFPKIAHDMIRWFIGDDPAHWINRCPFWQEED